PVGCGWPVTVVWRPSDGPSRSFGDLRPPGAGLEQGFHGLWGGCCTSVALVWRRDRAGWRLSFAGKVPTMVRSPRLPLSPYHAAIQRASTGADDQALTPPAFVSARSLKEAPRI